MEAKVQQIRKRTSYIRWQKMVKELTEKGQSPKVVLPMMFSMLDSMSAFGSNKASTASRESMELVLQDSCST